MLRGISSLKSRILDHALYLTLMLLLPHAPFEACRYIIGYSAKRPGVANDTFAVTLSRSLTLLLIGTLHQNHSAL